MYRPTHPHSNLLLDHLVQYVPYRIVSCASCKMCAVHLGNATRSKLVCLCDRLSAVFECDLPSVESGILKLYCHMLYDQLLSIATLGVSHCILFETIEQPCLIQEISSAMNMCLFSFSFYVGQI